MDRGGFGPISVICHRPVHCRFYTALADFGILLGLEFLHELNHWHKTHSHLQNKTRTNMSDYETRAQNFGLALEAELKQTLEDGLDVVLLDVRTEQEIAASGKFERQGRKWLQVACSPDSAEVLANTSDSLFPSKNTPIIIYCGSGRRATTAKKALEEKDTNEF